MRKSKAKTAGAPIDILNDQVVFNGTVSELLNRAETLRDFVVSDENRVNRKHPHADIYASIDHYGINKKGCLIYTNGDNITPVCYGSLIIREVITKDNGASKEIYFRIEGITQNGDILPPVIVSAADFDSLNWIRKSYGADIVAAPAQSAKQKLIAGVALSGQKAPKSLLYTHTGYLTEKGRPVDYLHAGGALRSDDINNELSESLTQYKLTGASANSQERVQNINISMQLLNAHAPGVCFPLFAFCYLPPLMPIIKAVAGDIGFCLYLQGKTQSGKSTLAGLVMSHYGSFTATRPPVTFNSTAGYINKLAFYLKDSILWIDDYHPQGTKRKQDETAQIFQDIARAAGDHAARGRLTSSAKLQKTLPPRCLYLATGEDTPAIGQSGAARVFTLELSRERKEIKPLLNAARTGLLSRALSDYINYIIDHYERLTALFKAYHDQVTEKAITSFNECRLTDQVTILYTSALMYLSYAETSGAITREDKNSLQAEFWKHIKAAALNLEDSINKQDPAQMYISALRALISTGRRFVIPLYGSGASYDLDSRGDIIGWNDDKYYYLDGNAAYKAVCDYYNNEGLYFNISRSRLNNDLLSSGALMPNNEGGAGTCKRIGGKVKRLLVFERETLEETERGRGL